MRTKYVYTSQEFLVQLHHRMSRFRRMKQYACSRCVIIALTIRVSLACFSSSTYSKTDENADRHSEQVEIVPSMSNERAQVS